MGFKTSLYKALDAATDVRVNGAEVTHDLHQGAGYACRELHVIQMRQPVTFYLQDEEVEVGDDGTAECSHWDVDENRQPYNSFPDRLHLRLKVVQPLRQS